MTREAHAGRTRAGYDSLAPVWPETTDDSLWNEVLDRRPIRSLLPATLQGATVLDAGMAAGTISLELLDRGADVTGIDVSPAMVETARHRSQGRGRFLVADLAEPLPFPDASFDGIVASLVLHYLRDWSVPLGSFARVLRPGGWLIVSLDHPDSPFSRANRNSYFATELLTDEWSKAGITIEASFWRRPLADVINTFADAGFVLERLLEPRATEDDRSRYSDDAARLEDVPFRAVYRWRRLPIAG